MDTKCQIFLKNDPMLGLRLIVESKPNSKEIIFKPPTRQKLHNYVQKAKDGFHKTKKQNNW